MANLFQQGDFTLHSGERSALKIECDALTTADWDTLAAMVAERFTFWRVIGIPNGGTNFARALHHYDSYRRLGAPTLLVDDVLTTGESMESMRRTLQGDVIGVVAFARRDCPDWIHPIFRMW